MSERLRITPLVEENTAWLHARERLWLTEDGERLVPDGHPDAASLFVAAGHRISRADAERLGLLDDGHDVADLPAVADAPANGGLTITSEAEPEPDAEPEHEGDQDPDESEPEHEQKADPAPGRPRTRNRK